MALDTNFPVAGQDNDSSQFHANWDDLDSRITTNATNMASATAGDIVVPPEYRLRYVHPNGDDNNPGDIYRPWQNIQTAVNNSAVWGVRLYNDVIYELSQPVTINKSFTILSEFIGPRQQNSATGHPRIQGASGHNKLLHWIGTGGSPPVVHGSSVRGITFSTNSLVIQDDFDNSGGNNHNRRLAAAIWSEATNYMTVEDCRVYNGTGQDWWKDHYLCFNWKQDDLADSSWWTVHRNYGQRVGICRMHNPSNHHNRHIITENRVVSKHTQDSWGASESPAIWLSGFQKGHHISGNSLEGGGLGVPQILLESTAGTELSGNHGEANDIFIELKNSCSSCTVTYPRGWVNAHGKLLMAGTEVTENGITIAGDNLVAFMAARDPDFGNKRETAFQGEF